MSKKEDNNDPDPGPSQAAVASPRHGQKKSKKGDPDAAPDYQRGGKRRQSRGGKTKKRDDGLSPEVSVLRSRKGSKARVKRRLKAPNPEGGKLSKETPVEGNVDLEGERQEMSPKQKECVHHGGTSGRERKGDNYFGTLSVSPARTTEGPPVIVSDADATAKPSSPGSLPTTTEHSVMERASRVILAKARSHELDGGVALPSPRIGTSRRPLMSADVQAGAQDQETCSRRPNAMSPSGFPRTGAGGRVSGLLYDINEEKEPLQVQSVTLKEQHPQPPIDKYAEKGHHDSVSPEGFSSAAQHRKSAQMTTTDFPRSTSKLSVISEGFEHKRLAEPKDGMEASPKHTTESPRGGFVAPAGASAKESLLSPDFQTEKTEVRQIESPKRMTEMFESHVPDQRYLGVHARRSVAAVKEDLTPLVGAYRQVEKKTPVEDANPEPNQILDKVEVVQSNDEEAVRVTKGLDLNSRLQQDQRAIPTAPRPPRQGSERADTVDRPMERAQPQTEWDHRLRTGYASSGAIVRSSQQPSPIQVRSRKPSRANVKRLSIQADRSTQRGRDGRARGNVDEFVEKMSVKPMFQDGCRRGSYIITADMEQFIPKHVIATAAGTDAQTQKLTPHKLCLLLLMVTLAVFLLIVYSLPDNRDELVTVNTTSGMVQGSRISLEKSTVYAFLGIPFGKSPTAMARFLRPQPVTPREDVIDGTKAPQLCAQFRPSANPGDRSWNDTSEDCLSLSVWTPWQAGRPMVAQGEQPGPYKPTSGCAGQPPSMGVLQYFTFAQLRQEWYYDSRRSISLLNRGDPRTVLFVLHGRDFKWSREYNAAALSALGDLVVVVPNYRLHLLGFLGNGTEVAPGNLALHDQVLALRWTVDNAEMFGGNRSSVVILGHGSGAVSLGLHLVSPVEEQDLWPVTRLAFMSGSPLQPLATNTEVSVVAASLGCNGTFQERTAQSQWACLLHQPASEFVRGHIYAGLAAGPSFDTDYLPQRWPQPSDRVFRKHILIGNTVSEGTVEIALKMQLLGEDGGNLSAFIVDEMQSLSLADFEALRGVYANATGCTNPRCTADFKFAQEMYGDVMTRCPVLYFSEYLSSLGHSVYSYLLNYKSLPLPVEESGQPVTFRDDLALLFGEPLLDASGALFNEQDISRKLIEVFSGFAKTGSLPHASNADWPRFSRSHNYHVRIDQKGTELISDTRNVVCDSLRPFILPPGYPALPDRDEPARSDRYF